MANENPYLNDSLLFFKLVSSGINQNLTKEDSISLLIYLALGIERLLKGILYSINPVYILITPEFKNSLPVFYKSRILPEATGTKEIAESPNEDVITFRNSLLRSQLLSKTANNNKSLLFTISNARDIIAHHELSKLDYDNLKLLLLRDYYPLMKSFSDELSIKPVHIFYGKHIQLARFSSKLQDSIEKKIELKFEAIRATFKMLEPNPGYIEDKDSLTIEAFNKGNKFIAKCPCCGYNALIYAKPIFEFNPYEKVDIKIGYEIKKLKCFYCKLEAVDYKELDYLKISIPPIVDQEKTKKCIKCGLPFIDDRGTGLCHKCDEYYGTEK
jgi:hypothetical protein